MTELAETIAAWRHSLDAVVGLGESLADRDWDAPTECPDWSVRDVYAHLVGGELWMAAGHPRPERGLAHIAAEPVAARRGRPATEVLEELREVREVRYRQLTDAPPDPDEPAYAAWGQPVPLGMLWLHRAFDLWVHEQDIRRAVARPGNLGSPGARAARALFIAALPAVVAKRAGAPPGSVVRVTVRGPVPLDHSVRVDADGRGRSLPETPDAVTSVLTMGWESFARLACGRIPADRAAAELTGDVDLGRAVLTNLSITP
ncbi:maleylpyruvate isomerase family mycothiol-dependent enzyme [Plantactinospora siamensis]|uniref:Maleylpyruvate isomerase family mycothiol-dependent enzyme n=1 Tax=Plantactinospora siamensis TaxID=555372 RepID=A0ABV6NV68_9ACTN